MRYVTYLTYCQEGVDEFERTGTYPRRILVYDPVLNKRWQRKIKEEKCSGELKMGNKIIYTYFLYVDLDDVGLFHPNGKRIEDCLMAIEMRD